MGKADNSDDVTAISERAAAIISEMDQAASKILDASEFSHETLERLRAMIGLPDGAAELLAEMVSANERIVASCSSHDVIKQHLELLIRDLEKCDASSKASNMNEKLLAGPELDGQGLHQQDIDDLLK